MSIRRITRQLYPVRATPTPIPESLLYSIAAGIGGTGLNRTAFESVIGAEKAGILGRALAYKNNQTCIPKSKIQLLAHHPVRLLSFLKREYYVGAKKHALDRTTARLVRSGRYDLLHSWSGDCVESLRAANDLGIPSVIEIPTWHRNKGKIKKDRTWSEIQRDAAPFPRSILNRLLVTRQQVMEEYNRATLILFLSERARETFLIAGIAPEKLFFVGRGADPDLFIPGSQPAMFRAIFVGSLIRRKGVHHLLTVWKKLALPNAELVLVGTPSPEIQALLKDSPGSVVVRGHVADVAAEFQNASVHIFPSECEGSAKVTYEAAACGLAQITTREAGDVVVDGLNGLVIPPNDPTALASAIRTLHANPERVAQMGRAARSRIVESFTWDHFRQRLLNAYSRAIELNASK